ncbi:DUF3073 domain-containing protein [Micrococcales bacterium 31B]|nr:DUF3073 domain-containing protein [Micrococcales bacterium 31B]
MGRGRQKAKQTKVARQLKYYSPDTNYDQLQRELSTGGGLLSRSNYDSSPVDAEEDDEFGDYDDVEDDDTWSAKP